MPPLAAKTFTTALRAREIPPLVAGATTLPGGKHVTGFTGRLRLPANPVPLPPPQFGGATKGKRLNGQARRLTSPLWRSYAGPPQGHYNPCTYCRAIYEKIVSRCFILPPEQGEVRRSRIGGGERSEPIRRMVILPYDADRLIRNADFISIARRAIHHPQPEGPSPPERSDAQRTHFEGAKRRTKCSESFPLWGHNPSAQPAAPAAPLFYKTCGEAATTTLGPEGPSNLRTLRPIGPVHLKNLPV